MNILNTAASTSNPGIAPRGKVDAITPHKIAVVLIVQQYLKMKQLLLDDLNGPTNLSTSTRRRFCMLLLKLIQYPDMTYNNLYNILTSPKYKIEQVHLEGFEKCMSELNVLGIENLLDVFDTQYIMEKLLSESSGISQFGIVGLYIRRIVLTLDKMSFTEMRALYKSISLYYEKGLRVLAICPTAGAGNLKDCEISSTGHNDSCALELQVLDEQISKNRNTHSKWSIKQAELFIAQQSLLLENNELKALKPIEMQSKLNEIIQDNPLYPQAHFLSYMNNLRLRDFFNSLDCLYRTFDRNPAQNCSTSSPYTRGFQYSSLNLAILHASFNHKKEALVSLKECIMLAQESGDKQCLDLANAWYCVLNETNVDPLDKYLPDQSDLSMIELLTLSIQFIVKIASFCGYRPSDLFQILMKSDKINCHDSLIEYVGSSLAMKSALWTLYGKNELGSICGQLLLKLKNIWMFGDFGNSESICQVLCCLALWLSVQGEYALTLVVLHHAKERFPRMPLAKNWVLCENYIKISQSIHKCKWQDAMNACCQLSIFDKNISILQRCAVYIAKRNVIIARLMLNKFLESINLDSLNRVRGLILLAYSMINQDVISAQVIDILGVASRICKDEYLEYEGAIVEMIFAHVLLQNRMPQKALQTIAQCMEVILANGGIYDKGKTLFLFFKCLIASANNEEEKIARIIESSGIITEIISYFKKLENHAKVLDVYIYLACVFSELQMNIERNKYAYKFKQYHNEFKINSEYLNVFY